MAEEDGELKRARGLPEYKKKELGRMAQEEYLRGRLKKSESTLERLSI